MRSHRETYPEQYAHPLVGKRVVVRKTGSGIVAARGTVTRVVSTRFGLLAILDGNAGVAWAVTDCTEAV